MQERRQRPAVPLKLKKRPLRLRAVCSSKRCPSRKIACMRVSNEYPRFKWPQRVWIIPTLGSVKKWIVRFSKSLCGTKSASRIQTNSPSARLKPDRQCAGFETGAINPMN